MRLPHVAGLDEQRSRSRSWRLAPLRWAGCSAHPPRDATFTARAALDAGVNLIDVAPQYGQGLAEERVGKSIAALPGRSFFLSTKVGRLLEPVAVDRAVAPNWAEGLPFATVYDVTPEGIRRSVSDSIARLGGRKPDILLLHDPDRYAEGPELTRLIECAHATLTVLKEEGAVKAIGIGVNAPEPCLMGLDIGEWDCFLLAGESLGPVKETADFWSGASVHQPLCWSAGPTCRARWPVARLGGMGQSPTRSHGTSRA